MAILTSADIPLYFPCSDLSEQQIMLLFRQAQGIAEGPLCSDRPLEATAYTDRLWMAGNILNLSYAPIAASPAPVVKIRYNGDGRDSFGRNVPTGEFITLTTDQYEIDTALGELRVTEGLVVEQTYSTAYPYSYGGNPYQQGYDPHRPNRDTNVQVTYTAGFTFTGSLGADAQRIKDAVAAIAAHMASPLYSGIVEIRTQREGTVKYGREGATPGLYGVGAGQLPEMLLLPFRRYRSRSVGMF